MREEVKWMIASDLHGDRVCTEALLDRFRESGAERLVLLGDLLYHGPRNDLPQGYDPKGVIALLNERKDQLICVRGNCEAEVDQMVLEFPVLAEYALLCREGLTVFATHGHTFHMKHPPSLGKGDILLHGHTHVPAAEPFGKDCLYLNPGSVSLPKEGSPKSYIIWQGREFIFFDLDGKEYRRVKV